MADEMLASFVAEQRADLASGQVEAIALDSRKRLLSDFKRSASFKDGYSRLINVMSLPQKEDDLVEVRRDFSGLFFEGMAYMYLQQSGIMEDSHGPLTLLSPENTLQFYSNLFSEAPGSVHRTGRESLHGVVVPDGILASGDGYVHAVLEYTAHGGKQYFEDKINGFTQIKNLDKLKGVFDGSQLIFVTPTFSNNKPRGVEVREMPFTHKQLRDFINDIFHEYRIDSDSATAVEAQQEARGQLTKRLDILGRERLTPEQRAYLEKVLGNDPALFAHR